MDRFYPNNFHWELLQMVEMICRLRRTIPLKNTDYFKTIRLGNLIFNDTNFLNA